MTDTAFNPPRPVPRWLHVLAVATAAVTLVLLVLGGLVTTFRVGMADPVWPTEPWYLFFIDWREPSRGFLIEHTHRLAGFTVGGLVGLLALGLWYTDPRSAARWAGLLGLVVLIGMFNQFHRAMMAQRDAATITVPVGAVGGMAGSLVLVLAPGIAGMMGRTRGSGLRLLGVVGLVAVMIQGLLGGFRVRLNELVGTDLAAVHGVFAQVVFSLLVCLAVLTGRPVTSELPDPTRRILGRLSLALVAVLFVQLIWGAMIRHAPTPLVQRLHLLTAFVAVAVAVWLLRVGFGNPAARPRVAFAGWVLGVLITLQVVLGVEAWMGKFNTNTLPELEVVTPEKAAIRTAHVLVGTGVLAAAVALAVAVRRRREDDSPDAEDTTRAGVLKATVEWPALVGVQPGDAR